MSEKKIGLVIDLGRKEKIKAFFDGYLSWIMQKKYIRKFPILKNYDYKIPLLFIILLVVFVDFYFL